MDYPNPFRATVFAAMISSITLISGSTEPVFANGPHVTSQQAFSEPVGAYQIEVMASHTAENIHFTISLSSRDDGQAIDGATIQIDAQDPGTSSSSEGPILAQPNNNPGFYIGDVPIPGGQSNSNGWLFSLLVESPLGVEQVEFPVRIQSQKDNSNWGSIVLILVILAAGARLLIRREKPTK